MKTRIRHWIRRLAAALYDWTADSNEEKLTFMLQAAEAEVEFWKLRGEWASKRCAEVLRSFEALQADFDQLKASVKAEPAKAAPKKIRGRTRKSESV